MGGAKKKEHHCRSGIEKANCQLSEEKEQSQPMRNGIPDTLQERHAGTVVVLNSTEK